jgi:hypothetical protein
LLKDIGRPPLTSGSVANFTTFSLLLLFSAPFFLDFDEFPSGALDKAGTLPFFLGCAWAFF